MQRTREALQPISHEDLKTFAAATGPCVTLLFPIQHGENTSEQDRRLLHETCRQAEAKLRAAGLDKASTAQLIAPALELTGSEWDPQPGTLVVLSSPDLFRYFHVPVELEEAAYVGDGFHLLPVIGSVAALDQEFYILALALNHVRLLHCTQSESHEVPLSEAMPRSLEQWLNTRTPDSSPDHDAVKDPASGPTGAFTSSSDADNKGQHIANFFHAVNKAVVEKLHNDERPLVLAAVEHEVSLYRSINTYAHLASNAVLGSADGLKGGELHKRALEAVQPYFAQPLERALALYEKLGGTERVSSNIETIVKGAVASRVAHLIAAEDARMPGRFDSSTLELSPDPSQEEDLINTAARHTIALGGEVFIVPRERVPGAGPVAAVFRY